MIQRPVFLKYGNVYLGQRDKFFPAPKQCSKKLSEDDQFYSMWANRAFVKVHCESLKGVEVPPLNGLHEYQKLRRGLIGQILQTYQELNNDKTWYAQQNELAYWFNKSKNHQIPAPSLIES